MLGEGKYESLTGTNVYPRLRRAAVADHGELGHAEGSSTCGPHTTSRASLFRRDRRPHRRCEELSCGLPQRAPAFVRHHRHGLAYAPRALRGRCRGLRGGFDGTDAGSSRRPGTALAPSFGHIFAGGYAAGYYGYKWAEVLEADAFSLFEERGIFDRKTADSFRRNLLSRGGTEHPMKLYVAFRGHKPRDEGPDREDGSGKEVDSPPLSRTTGPPRREAGRSVFVAAGPCS